LEGEEDDLKLMRRSQYQEPAAENTYKALVLAKSRTLEKLSRDMAAAFKKAWQTTASSDAETFQIQTLTERSLG
jgi:hypothetical protein